MDQENPRLASVQPETPETPGSVDWDFQISFPTNWNIRGKNPTMHLLNDEQIEALTSSGNPLPQNFFFFTAGIAAALIIQLKSGVADSENRFYLWIAFFAALILALFFGSFAILDYVRARRVKQAIKRQSPVVQADAPMFRAQSKQ